MMAGLQRGLIFTAARHRELLSPAQALHRSRETGKTDRMLCRPNIAIWDRGDAVRHGGNR